MLSDILRKIADELEEQEKPELGTAVAKLDNIIPMFHIKGVDDEGDRFHCQVPADTDLEEIEVFNNLTEQGCSDITAKAIAECWGKHIVMIRKAKEAAMAMHASERPINSTKH